MFRNHITVALRSLLRHKLHTFINVFGLAVGLASCTLILLYVRHELSYDRFFPNAQRTFRVVDELEIPAVDVHAATALTPYPMAPALEAEFPEVERATRVSLWENARTLVGHDDRWLYEHRMLYADAAFLQVLAFPVRDGDPTTALDEPGSVVLTAAAARRHFGDGTQTNWINHSFLFRSFHHTVEPLVIQLTSPTAGKRNFDFVAVRVDAAVGSAVLGGLEQARHRVLDDHPFEYAFLDAQVAALYGNEERAGLLVGAFAVIAVIVACLGLFALAADTAQRRTKEVGLRKALGATVTGIVALLSGEFLKLALLANLVAWPVAWWSADRWLRGFAYRVDVSPGLFAVTALATLSVAWLAVAWQTVHAARTNPVDALRCQ